jgi:hypothetical protein
MILMGGCVVLGRVDGRRAGGKMRGGHGGTIRGLGENTLPLSQQIDFYAALEPSQPCLHPTYCHCLIIVQ